MGLGPWLAGALLEQVGYDYVDKKIGDSMGNALTLPRGNPYAPEWMTGIFRPPETPAGYEDRRRDYAKTITVSANSTLFNQAMPIDGNTDFLAREFEFGVKSGTFSINYGDIQVRFRDGAGNRLSQDFLNIQDIEGPIFPQLLLPSGTNVLIDAKNNTGSSITFQCIFGGVKRFTL